jgi:hypothetical protein
VRSSYVKFLLYLQRKLESLIEREKIPLLTKRDIEEMSGQEYKRQMFADPAFRKHVDYLYKDAEYPSYDPDIDVDALKLKIIAIK